MLPFQWGGFDTVFARLLRAENVTKFSRNASFNKPTQLLRFGSGRVRRTDFQRLLVDLIGQAGRLEQRF